MYTRLVRLNFYLISVRKMRTKRIPILFYINQSYQCAKSMTNEILLNICLLCANKIFLRYSRIYLKFRRMRADKLRFECIFPIVHTTYINVHTSISRRIAIESNRIIFRSARSFSFVDAVSVAIVDVISFTVRNSVNSDVN